MDLLRKTKQFFNSNAERHSELYKNVQAKQERGAELDKNELKLPDVTRRAR